jgi:long-subunit fatty acid transport protein
MGAAHAPDDKLTLYGGINYGRNPFPARNLTPVIAAIGELHLTGGFAWRLQGGWIASGALEYLVPKNVSYDNPAFPLGQSEERLSYAAVHLMLGRRW